MSGRGPGREGQVLLLVGRSTGGIGGHVASLARGLGARRWDTVVVTADTTARRFDLGPDVQLLWPPRSASRLRALRSLMAASDVVHAHGHQAGLVAVGVVATLPSRQRPPVVVSWHNAVLGSGGARRARALLERLQARRADLLTGASADLVERARLLGAADAELAPVAAADAGSWRGDRDAARADLAAALGLDAGGPWVLTVSRVAQQKHLPVLVDAAARLRDVHGLTWLVVGDGDPALRARLDDQVRGSGAPVRFLGARRDVPALMALTDVFALPSAWEARALVVQEAMAAGTPVVATAVGGLPELLDGVDGPAGLLVPAGDPAALADAVRRLVVDRAEAARLGAAGRERFATLPDEAQVLDAWTSRYARLAGRGGGAATGGTHLRL